MTMTCLSCTEYLVSRKMFANMEKVTKRSSSCTIYFLRICNREKMARAPGTYKFIEYEISGMQATKYEYKR